MIDNRQDILSRIRSYIDRHIPLSPTGQVLVGLSGGADSVALLSILTVLGYRCVACHCNFRLRGDEAMRDRDFAAAIATQIGVPFYETAFDTREYAATHKLSIEMACRELRYDWFEHTRRELGADFVAVAHHRDDSVETMLLNLIRGTGIAGLTGIQPVNGKVIRPLLSLSRTEIETYLVAEGLTFVVDSTNRETLYTRNKIRLQLLPFLAEINPSIYDALTRTADRLHDVEAIYRDAIDRSRTTFVSMADDGLHIHIEALRRLPGARSQLFELIREYGFLPSQLDDIWYSLDAPSGRCFDAPQYRLLKDRTDFVLYLRDQSDVVYTIDADVSEVSLPVHLSLSRHEKSGYTIPRSRMVVSFDADALPALLTIRRWREGDRFRPFGMKGSQKLSDYFNNHKYSLARKQNTWLLCAGDEIVWIIGERASDRFKITDDTLRVLRIEILP